MSTTRLHDFTPQTQTQSITRTVVIKLRSNNRKRRRVRTAVDRWQAMASHFADLLPSVMPHKWGETKQPWVNDLAQREFPTDEIDVRAHERDQALFKVSEAFGSWRERGRQGNRPQFGDGDYLRLCNCGVNVDRHTAGWGVKLSLEPYKPEWFQAEIGEYQREWLERVTDGDASTGTAEIHLRGGDVYCHLTISAPVEVYEASDVSRWVGVDLGERVLYAAALTDSNGVQQVEVESGREFRHHRDRLDDKRAAAQHQGKQEQISRDRMRYTEQVCNRASREIVKLAAKNNPAAIRLEDLTNYRRTAKDPIHDWPFAKLQEMVSYKAIEEGVPVEMVNPRDTSVTCRECGTTAPAFRSGNDWHCKNCGYQVHADVNAAINIANGGVE